MRVKKHLRDRPASGGGIIQILRIQKTPVLDLRLKPQQKLKEAGGQQSGELYPETAGLFVAENPSPAEVPLSKMNPWPLRVLLHRWTSDLLVERFSSSQYIYVFYMEYPFLIAKLFQDYKE